MVGSRRLLPLLLVVNLGCFVDAVGVAASGGGGSGAGDGAGPSGGSPNGGGGGGQCDTPADCGTPGECESFTCEDGQCGRVEADPGTECGAAGHQCNERGECLAVDGERCAEGAECLSGFCADATCCDVACDADCQSCGTGACEPAAAGEDPESECGDGVCDGASGCAVGSTVNGSRFGSDSPSGIEGWVLDVGSNNAVTFGGNFRGSHAFGAATLSATLQDAFVARVGSSNQLVWATRLGGSLDEDVTAVAIAPDDSAVVTGYFTGTIGIGAANYSSAGGADLFIARLAPLTGVPSWSVAYGSGMDQLAAGVAIDSAGNIVVVGTFSGTLDFGDIELTSNASTQDIFVAKLSPAGAVIWAKRFGGTGSERGRDVAIRSDDSIVITGVLTGTTMIGGATLQDDSGGAYVAVLDPDGDALFADIIDGNEEQYAWTVAVSPDDSFALCGGLRGTSSFAGENLVSSGDFDALVAVWGPDNEQLWARRFGDAAAQTAWGIDFDPSGNLLVSGDMAGSADFGGGALTSAGGTDFWVAKFAGDGTHLWSRRYGDAVGQVNNALRAGPQGQPWILGWFFGSIDFGSNVLLTNQQERDTYLVQLSP